MNNRSSRRARNKKSLQKMKHGWTKFEQINLLESDKVPIWCTRAFQNALYIVQINDNAMTSRGKAINALIQRWDNSKVSDWSDVQRIKNEIFGNEKQAQYFPPESKKIDDFNIYWIWLYPDNIIPET